MLNAQFASSFAVPDVPAGPEPLPLPLPPPGVAELPSVECSSDDVLHLLATIRHNTATGPDGLSSTMLHSTSLSTAETLTSIFNQSLQQGVVPADWKQSNVTPIVKSGDPSVAANYRPISLLSLVSKDWFIMPSWTMSFNTTTCPRPSSGSGPGPQHRKLYCRQPGGGT